MRKNIILFILLSFLISGKEKQSSPSEMARILTKKKAIQKFAIPTEIENHPEWKELKTRHILEINQLREEASKMQRNEFKKIYRDLIQLQKDDEYQLFKKLKI